jgi:ribosomal protein L22
MNDQSRYTEMKVDELAAELEARGLPKSGKKDDLIARLLDDDAAQGGTAPEAEATEESTVDTRQSTGEDPDADASAEDEDEGADAAGEPKRRRGLRRGAAETTAPAARPKGEAKVAPLDPSGAVAVRAQAKYVRSAPRKARLVMNHIRGKDVADARAILRHTPRAVAADISKLLESAVANAENNFELDPDDLKVGRAYVDEGPTIKRYRPRALGRATRINKRTSHMTITLTTTGDR